MDYKKYVRVWWNLASILKRPCQQNVGRAKYKNQNGTCRILIKSYFTKILEPSSEDLWWTKDTKTKDFVRFWQDFDEILQNLIFISPLEDLARSWNILTKILQEQIYCKNKKIVIFPASLLFFKEKMSRRFSKMSGHNFVQTVIMNTE